VKTPKEPKDTSLTSSQGLSEARELMKLLNKPNEMGELPERLVTLPEAIEMVKKGEHQFKSPIRLSRMESLPPEGQKEIIALNKEIEKEIRGVMGWTAPDMVERREEAMEVIHKEFINKRDEILKQYTN